MTDRLVPVVDYLTYAEAAEVYQALELQGVEVLVKSCGPPNFPFGEGRYFQLLVQEQDVAHTAPVLASFSEKQSQNKAASLTCPACGSVYVGPAAKLPFWKKFYYAGTAVFTCSDCRKTFST